MVPDFPDMASDFISGEVVGLEADIARSMQCRRQILSLERGSQTPKAILLPNDHLDTLRYLVFEGLLRNETEGLRRVAEDKSKVSVKMTKYLRLPNLPA